jgi:hypothetical protein
MTSMNIALYYFSLLLGLIMTSVGLGYGLRWLAWGRPLVWGYAQVLYSGLAGAVTLATVGALWWTRGATIHLLAVLVGLFMWYEARREKAQPITEIKSDHVRSSWWSYWPLLAGAVLVYSFCAWGFVRPGAYVPFNIPETQASFSNDQVYSARIAYFSKISGQESDVFLLQLLDPAYSGAKPYHYLELWLTNLISSIVGDKQVIVLYLVAYPFFYWLALVGIFSLWKAAGHRISGWTFLASLALMFVAGFTYEFYDSIPFLSLLYNFKFPMVSGLPKLGQVYAFLLVFALLAQEGKYMWACLALLMLGASYVVVFPPIGIATGVAVGCAFALNLAPRPAVIRTAGYVLALGAGVAAFYHFLDVSTLGREGTSTRDLASLLGSLAAPETLRTRLNILGGTPLQMGVLYGPFLLAAVFFGFELWHQARSRLAEACFWVVLIGAGMAAWAIFYKHLNSVQLFTNLSIPTANVLIFRFAVWLAGQPGGWRRWAGGLVIAISAIWLFWESLRGYPLKNLPPTFADSYLQKVDGYLKTQPGLWLAGASIRHPNAFASAFEKYVTIYSNGGYLAYLGNGGAMTVSLNDAEIPLATDPLIRAREQQAIGMGLFYRWVAREKAAGSFRDVPTSQRDFVRHYKLKFLIISRGVDVPAPLRPLVIEEFADDISGERFLVLDLER